MSHWFEQLEKACREAGMTAVVWKDAVSHARMLLLPEVGRIMACELPGAAGNVFYHHPKLQDENAAADLLAGGGGIGGDRLWIAPESAYMWSDLVAQRQDLGVHARTPPAMDPAAYQILRQAPRLLELQSPMKLTDHRSGQPLTLRVRRRFEWLDTRSRWPRGVVAMSFAIENDVTLLEAEAASQAGAWDLLQLPPGGTLICPTRVPADRSQVRSYYESLENHVRLTDDAVLLHIDSQRCVKMGLLPELTAGVMAYYRHDAKTRGSSTLVVRTFHPCVGMKYIDLPVDEVIAGERSGGDALQAYNHGTLETGFGEMEYHDPAVTADGDVRQRVGVSVTHVLAGPDESIRQAGQSLIGAPVVSFSE